MSEQRVEVQSQILCFVSGRGRVFLDLPHAPLVPSWLPIEHFIPTSFQSCTRPSGQANVPPLPLPPSPLALLEAERSDATSRSSGRTLSPNALEFIAKFLAHIPLRHDRHLAIPLWPQLLTRKIRPESSSLLSALTCFEALSRR